MVSIYINARLLGTLANAIQSHAAPTAYFVTLGWLLAAMGATAALGQFLNRLTETIQRLYQKRAANYVQGVLVEKTAAMDLAFFENPEFHNQMKKASNEAGNRPYLIVQQLMLAITSMTTIISLGTVVSLWHVWLLPLVLLAPVVMFRLSARMAADDVAAMAARTETDRKAQYFRSVLTEDSMAKEVRLYSLQPYLLTGLRSLWNEIYGQDRLLARRKLISRGVFGALLTLDRPLLFGYAAIQLLALKITLGQFSLYTQSIMALQSSLYTVSTALAQLHESHLFVTHLFDFLALSPRVEAPRPPVSGGISKAPQIEFRHVSFSYPGSHRLVLEDVSFELAAGEVLALAGKNGSGKTTVVKLLAGFYEPLKGQILLDGIDIQTLDRTELRRHFSMILQDFRIYHFPIYENIAVGALDALDDHPKLEAAAQRTGLDKVVAGLPHGYNTVLGHHFKRGHELSGGQRQLVALSRAHLRAAPILVLDEPTAALDVQHERHVFEQVLRDRPREQSVMIISHRLTAVRHADRILVLEGGQLLESGSHDSLMAENGLYAEMFKVQLGMFNDTWMERSQSIGPQPAAAL